VTRPRSSAPGPHRPSRRRSLSNPTRLLPLVAILTLVVAACGGAATTGTAKASTAPGATLPVVAASVDPGSSGLKSVPAASSASPTATPTEASPATTEPAPSAALEPAADCTGTAENRTFYGSVAAAVDWTVYCPVLPSGWFVEQGSYRLAGGGRLVITYRGPAGAHLTLSEGVWCTDGSGCVPAGSDSGAAAFGDRDGALVTGAGGTDWIVVDAGSTISWQLAGSGIDESTVRMVGAALIAVGD
jgi:hypothetical protein